MQICEFQTSLEERRIFYKYHRFILQAKYILHRTCECRALQTKVSPTKPDNHVITDNEITSQS